MRTFQTLLGHMAREAADGLYSYVSHRLHRDTLLAATPPGDGHPVLVLQGLIAPQAHVKPLGMLLKESGYTVYFADLGVNTGPQSRFGQGLPDRLHTIFNAHAKTPVTIVGHSMGGLFAAELARLFQDEVRGVVTLGSPVDIAHFASAGAARPMAAMLREFCMRIDPACARHMTDPEVQARILTPPPVRTTAIWSAGDRIVASQGAIMPDVENIAVQATHAALPYHPAALAPVLDRVAQPKDGYRPFDPSPYTKKFGHIVVVPGGQAPARGTGRSPLLKK